MAFQNIVFWLAKHYVLDDERLSFAMQKIVFWKRSDNQQYTTIKTKEGDSEILLHRNFGISFFFCFIMSALLCWFQSCCQLENRWNKNAQREGKTHIHHLVAAMEKVDELAIVHLWHNVIHDVGNTVVHPVESY